MLILRSALGAAEPPPSQLAGGARLLRESGGKLGNGLGRLRVSTEGKAPRPRLPLADGSGAYTTPVLNGFRPYYMP